MQRAFLVCSAAAVLAVGGCPLGGPTDGNGGNGIGGAALTEAQQVAITAVVQQLTGFGAVLGTLAPLAENH